LGRHDEERAAARQALDVIDKHLRLHPDDVRAIYFAAGHWSAIGEREKALEMARRALGMESTDSGARYNVACVFATEGLHEEALDLLEKNVEARWGFLDWIRNDPDLEPLRGHPRFARILEQLEARTEDTDG
jgi:adenylate cyclase